MSFACVIRMRRFDPQRRVARIDATNRKRARFAGFDAGAEKCGDECAVATLLPVRGTRHADRRKQIREQRRAFRRCEETGRFVVAGLAPGRFAILSNEAGRIGRCIFGAANMVEHALDQPQIAHSLRFLDRQLADEVRDGRCIDRRQVLLMRAHPREKRAPLRAIDIGRRATIVLHCQPCVERGFGRKNPVGCIAVEQVLFFRRGGGVGRGGKGHGINSVSCVYGSPFRNVSGSKRVKRPPCAAAAVEPSVAPRLGRAVRARRTHGIVCRCRGFVRENGE